MSRKSMMFVVICVALSGVLQTNVLNADIIVTEAKATTGNPVESVLQTALPTSATDLANSNQPSFGSIAASVADAYGYNATPTALVDGTYLSGENVVILGEGTCYLLGPGASATITINFDTSENTLGYDINSIVTSTGNVSNHNQQIYNVEVLDVGSTTWQSLASVSSTADNCTIRQMTISDNGGAVLASGVGAIRFNLTGPSGGMYSTYREFDVVGTATVPEPGTIALFVSGLSGLLAYAWRKRKN